jgi:hypothetical protein
MSTSAIRALRALSLSLLLAGTAGASDDPIEDIVAVLRDKGLIDDATEQQILAKRLRQQAAEPAPVSAGFEFLDGFIWSGDLRLRNEHFWYDSSFGEEADDRNRTRYRARIGFTKQVNERLGVGMRLASGVDHNSTNVSFGNDDEFGRDTILIDQVWADFRLSPPDSSWITTLTAGKVANPFLWKQAAGRSADRIVWDPDLSPEGMFLRTEGNPAGELQIFATAGYFVASEVSEAKDPKLLALQLGGSIPLGRHELGLRVSGYEWRSLDDAFIAQNLDGDSPATGGNLAGAFDSRARIAESAAYLQLAASPVGPAFLYAGWAKNLLADPTPPFDDEDTAWGAGFELGDEKTFARLGAGYFRVEANAVLSRFTDSDLFDGFTNREGLFVSLSRELASRVLLRLTLFDGEEIHSAVPIDPEDGSRADRKRLQSDVEIKF